MVPGLQYPPFLLQNANFYISKQEGLAAPHGVHVTPIICSRPILHRVAKIACSGFRSNQLHTDPRRFVLILPASTASAPNPVDQI